MHIRDLMTADQFVYESGYGWHFYNWARNTRLGPDYVYAQHVYRFFENAIHATNMLLAAIEESSATDIQKQYLGLAYAYRAMLYLDMARMYEYLPCDVTQPRSYTGKDIYRLTVPIITEKATTEEISRLTRATRQEMYDFILSDINKATTLLDGYERTNKKLPDLACVHGLKARLYMWVEDYANAAKSARQAIRLYDGTPLTESEMLDVENGFNSMTPSAWMWGAQPYANDEPVTSGIVNWTSWMSNEATFGYASVGPYVAITPSLYNEIRDGDIRKKLFKVTGDEPHLETSSWDDIPAYASLKFRPYQGKYDDYSVGAQSAYPLMRIEEMYLIEAEATAHDNLARGVALLNDFMQKYRDASYNLSTDSINEYTAVHEIVKQKRIELWGEGQTFFDIKRLNMAVDRTGQADANYISDYEKFATTMRPAWMNLPFVTRNGMTYKWNTAGEENPDPSDLYRSGGGSTEREQTFNVTLTVGFVNELFGGNAAAEAFTANACTLDSLEGIRLKAPFSAVADSTMDYDGADIAITLNGNCAAIPRQPSGFRVNGETVYIQSVKDGEYADGIIRFLSSTISAVYGNKSKTISCATEIRLPGCAYNPSVLLALKTVSSDYRPSAISHDGMQYMRVYMTRMNDLDEVRLACVPYEQRETAIERLKNDATYGAVAHEVGWVDIPMYEVDGEICYVCVGLLDGTIQYTNSSQSYEYPDYSMYIEDKEQTVDKTGVAVVQLRYTFGYQVDKAYLAFVDKYATEDEIRELYRKNQLPSMILAPFTPGEMSAAQIPFPGKYGEYKVVALAISNNKLVKVSEGDDVSETEYFENPSRELTVTGGKMTENTDGSLTVSFSYNAEAFEGAYVALLQDSLLTGNIWENVKACQDKVKITGSGTASVTVANPTKSAYYTLVICGYDDGRIEKDVKGDRLSLNEPWTKWYNSKSQWVANGMNAEDWPLGDMENVTCTYTYVNYWSGVDMGRSIYYRQSRIDATQAQFKVENWGAGTDLVIEYNPETSACQILPQYVVDNSSYGAVNIMDLPNLNPEMFTYQDFPCYYDKEVGLFTLCNAYVVSAGAWGGNPEYIQVDGFNAVVDSLSGTSGDSDTTHYAKARIPIRHKVVHFDKISSPSAIGGKLTRQARPTTDDRVVTIDDDGLVTGRRY